MDTAKMQKIKEEANKLGTSYYKFVDPFIVNINQRIGKGSYGDVYKGADTRTGKLIAVKTISTSNIKKDPEKFYQSLKNQIEITKKMKHENIVELYDVKKSPNNIYLFQELCNRGSLEQVLDTRKKIPESQALIIMQQIVRGYKYLHQHSIIHRDLKPANILINDETYKIADFGFAKHYQQGNQLALVMQSLVGSPMYMCPQILNGKTYSTKSDVWSIGVIFYQMIYGCPPFKASSLDELISKVNKKILRFPQKLKNPLIQDAMQKMLRFQPEERISWKDLFLLGIFAQQPEKKQDLNSSMQIAQKGTKDKLEMSTRVNQIYFGDKKVIQQIELAEKEEQIPSAKSEEGPQQDIYTSIANKYQETEKKKTIIRKIKNWFLFKRNKAVYLNHLSLKIHNCFALQKLNIPLAKAEVFILVLSKWQCMLTYKSYVRLKEGKANSKVFSEQQFQIFVKSTLRERLLEKFKNDFQVMKLFFDELMKKVEGYINKYEGQLPQNLRRIKRICNQALCPKEQFLKIFSENIDELEKVSLQAIKENPQCRQVIQLAYLVSEAKKLKKDQLETNDFSMIYDQEEKFSNENLLRKIQGKDIAPFDQ